MQALIRFLKRPLILLSRRLSRVATGRDCSRHSTLKLFAHCPTSVSSLGC